jgi:hypothetical protein
MADEVTPKEESGGIVTTVKTNESQDLDFLAAKAAREEAAGEKTADETPVEKAAVKDESKSGEKTAPTGEPKKEDEDLGAGPIDLEKLTPRERMLVERAYKDNRLVARREARSLKEQLAGLEAEIAGLKKGATVTPEPKTVREVGKPVRPRRTDFAEGKEGDTAFETATDKYEDDSFKYRKQVETQATEAERQRIEDKKVVDAYNEKADEFMETHPDYEDVMDSELPITAIMFGYMLENGPEFGYYLAKHPEETEKLARMSEKKQDRACMRIAVKIEQEAEASAKAKKDQLTETPKSETKEKKPDPPKPVSGRGNTTVAKDPAKMTFKEREREFARTHPGVLNYEP